MALGWLGTQVPLVCAGESPGSKPAPAPYLHAAAVLSVEPQRCVVFEDSLPGLRAARAAGMRSVALTACAAHPVEAARMADRALPDYRAW